MTIRATYDTADDIPEAHRDLFTERGGKFELTGVDGIQTDANIKRIEEALRKEKHDHGETRQKLHAWDGLEHDDVAARLDRIPALEAAAEGKGTDEEQIRKLVDARVIQERAPLDREAKKLRRELAQAAEQVANLEQADRMGRIERGASKALTGKIHEDAVDDALLQAGRMFEVAADGAIVTRDGVGVTPGLDPAAWVDEMLTKRRHWLPPSSGGGASGSGRGTGGGSSTTTTGPENPYSHAGWHVTRQHELIKAKGTEVAGQMAAAVGTRIGGMRPPPPK